MGTVSIATPAARFEGCPHSLCQRDHPKPAGESREGRNPHAPPEGKRPTGQGPAAEPSGTRPPPAQRCLGGRQQRGFEDGVSQGPGVRVPCFGFSLRRTADGQRQPCLGGGRRRLPSHSGQRVKRRSGPHRRCVRPGHPCPWRPSASVGSAPRPPAPHSGTQLRHPLSEKPAGPPSPAGLGAPSTGRRPGDLPVL